MKYRDLLTPETDVVPHEDARVTSAVGARSTYPCPAQAWAAHQRGRDAPAPRPERKVGGGDACVDTNETFKRLRNHFQLFGFFTSASPAGFAEKVIRPNVCPMAIPCMALTDAIVPMRSHAHSSGQKVAWGGSSTPGAVADADAAVPAGVGVEYFDDAN